MEAYEHLHPFFGDLHSHCGISYGHGPIEDAFRNAKERLDFCSVTGHAFWPDMPEPNERNREAVAYHVEGFERLREQWGHVQDVTQAWNDEGRFVTFLSFEMHSCASGDYTVVYRGGEGDILTCDGLQALRRQLRKLKEEGVDAIAFPHHTGYLRGRRGINWDSFTEEFSPVVEMVSMHGSSEADEGPRPMLHTMGPADHEGTIQYGLEKGHVFGLIGSTDHHSAHPGSHGHGLTGVWADAKTRTAIWEAILARRTYALTGDRIVLEFALNGHTMGAKVSPCKSRRVAIDVAAGGAIDCVDLLRNNRLVRRFSECDIDRVDPGDQVRTKLFLEVGWGQRGHRTDWDVTFGISAGRILAVEPRFKGPEVVSPEDKGEGSPNEYHTAHWECAGDRAVRFQAATFGNPNNFTRATQGMCLEVEMPRAASVHAVLNTKPVEIRLSRLLEGACPGYLEEGISPAYRFERAPLPWELKWTVSHEDCAGKGSDAYTVRVRQKNDQWAWSSPIFVG